MCSILFCLFICLFTVLFDRIARNNPSQILFGKKRIWKDKYQKNECFFLFFPLTGCQIYRHKIYRMSGYIFFSSSCYLYTIYMFFLFLCHLIWTVRQTGKYSRFFFSLVCNIRWVLELDMLIINQNSFCRCVCVCVCISLISCLIIYYLLHFLYTHLYNLLFILLLSLNKSQNRINDKMISIK